MKKIFQEDFKVQKKAINHRSKMDSLWLPFTPNRKFKDSPRLVTSAKDMYYFDESGEKILDAISGLWCVNAGHCRDPIVRAIKEQSEKLDYATAFNMSHDGAFLAAEAIQKLAPDGLNKVFFTNSGSEGVDTAMKIALGYHRCRGQGQKHRFIGREKGYHGVGFGGMSVGGISHNRRMFSASLLPSVDHLSHTLNLNLNAFSQGQPVHGVELAAELDEIIMFHDSPNIAAVIIEPVSGSAGVIIPPVGYLEKIKEVCEKHGILLVFDEVITGFGRTGKAFASETFGVKPDMIVFAKGVSNGTVPMGGVIVSDEIYETFMAGPSNGIEFYHGYTYSGHPLATASALSTLKLYKDEGLFDRSLNLSEYFQEAVHSLKGLPHIEDIRNFGMMCGIQLTADSKQPGRRAYEVFEKSFDRKVLVRPAGENIALTPPLIAERRHIDQIVETLDNTIRELD